MASRAAVALALALAALLPGAPSARAAETPMPVSYLDPYNMDWLAYLDPADVPPNPYAVCVVDTGVAITPDTPPDNPAGPIVKRYAFDGGTGEPQTTNSFGLHGTRMAMAASAPVNDWGTVGAWPGARIISMRATKGQEQFIPLRQYQHATFECAEDGRRSAVALLSLSCDACQATPADLREIRDAIVFAHARNVSVVVAAGNSPGEPHYPADQPGVFSVAAGSATGGLCPDSAFAESLAVMGPGCPVETADPLTGVPQVFSDGGTSMASAVAATLIAALRSLRPQSSYNQVETWVRDSARVVEGRRVLDGVAAARTAGVEDIVTRALSRMPVAADATPAAAPEPSRSPPAAPALEAGLEGRTLTRLPRPDRASSRARIDGRRLRVVTTSRPPGALVEVRAGHGQAVRAHDVMILSVRRLLRAVDLRYVPSSGDLVQPSPWLRLRRQAGGRFR